MLENQNLVLKILTEHRGKKKKLTDAYAEEHTPGKALEEICQVGQQPPPKKKKKEPKPMGRPIVPESQRQQNLKKQKTLGVAPNSTAAIQESADKDNKRSKFHVPQGDFDILMISVTLSEKDDTVKNIIKRFEWFHTTITWMCSDMAGEAEWALGNIEFWLPREFILELLEKYHFHMHWLVKMKKRGTYIHWREKYLRLFRGQLTRKDIAGGWIRCWDDDDLDKGIYYVTKWAWKYRALRTEQNIDLPIDWHKQAYPGAYIGNITGQQVEDACKQYANRPNGTRIKEKDTPPVPVCPKKVTDRGPFIRKMFKIIFTRKNVHWNQYNHMVNGKCKTDVGFFVEETKYLPTVDQFLAYLTEDDEIHDHITEALEICRRILKTDLPIAFKDRKYAGSGLQEEKIAKNMKILWDKYQERKNKGLPIENPLNTGISLESQKNPLLFQNFLQT